jgi:8-hydroxy-5-deazaflavin:NADPH oxidoreductase
MESRRVGVLGSGQVGRVLAAGFRTHGHEVTIGTRSPDDEELRAWAADAGVAVATFAETAAFAELAVFATRGTANDAVVELAGPERFAGTLVIDATNPLDFSGGGPALAVGWTDSGGERLQRALPGARVVKAFNTVGNTLMVDPQLPGGPPTMFVAGDDDAAKAAVADLLADFGWRAQDCGGIEQSRQLESLCLLWVAIAIARGGRYDHAFALLTG